MVGVEGQRVLWGWKPQNWWMDQIWWSEGQGSRAITLLSGGSALWMEDTEQVGRLKVLTCFRL